MGRVTGVAPARIWFTARRVNWFTIPASVYYNNGFLTNLSKIIVQLRELFSFSFLLCKIKIIMCEIKPTATKMLPTTK